MILAKSNKREISQHEQAMKILRSGGKCLVAYSIDQVEEDLKSLGLNEAFESSADFSKMGPGPLWISKVRQKTFIDVNEDGTAAAAATAISFTTGMPPPYTFDHPFIYLI